MAVEAPRSPTRYFNAEAALSPFRRLMGAIMETRRRQADEAITRYLSGRGGSTADRLRLDAGSGSPES